MRFLFFLNVGDFVDKGDEGIRETVEKNVDKELGFSSAVNKNEQEGPEKEEEDPEEFERKSEQLKEVFSCLPPVLIERILRRDDVKGNIERASQKLQEFQHIKNPADLFKNLAERRPLITKPEGKFEDPQTHGPSKQAWVAEDRSSGGPEHESNRGKKNRSKPREKSQAQGQHGDTERHDERRNGYDSAKSDQKETNQACQGHNSRQRGNTRAGPERGPRGGFYQGPNNTQVYREEHFYAPQGQWSGYQNAFLSQRGRGNQRGQRGCFRQDPIAGNRDNSLYKPPYAFPLISLMELLGNKIPAPSSFDDSDTGRFRQGEPSKRREGDRGSPRNRRGNRDAGQTGIRRAQSMSSVAEERPADQSQFERNKVLIRGLSEKTSRGGLVNFTEVKSGGEEVKDVQMLKNGKALADEIKGTYLSTKFED